MTTALVVSGGGDKGAFAVGAAEVLLEKGYQFDIITGTSTGALIAPMLAIGDIDELVKIYTSVTKGDILTANWWRPWRLWAGSLYDTKPLETLIRKTMRKEERFHRLQHASTSVFLCSVGFQTGRVWYWTQHEHTHSRVRHWESFDEFVRAVLASTNEPFIMPPVELGNEQCFDGGVREIAPVAIAKELGAEQVVVIANSPEAPILNPDRLDNIVEIGLRSIDLMTTEILNNDIRNHSDVIVIRPQDPLPSSGMEFVPEVMKRMMETGRQQARQVV